MKRVYILSLVALTSLTLAAHDFEVVNADGKTIYYKGAAGAEENIEVTYRGTWYGAYENNYSDTIVIPSTVTHEGKTYKVIGIGEQAFSICHNLKSVTIPESILYIGDKAFQECYKLEEVNYNAIHANDLSMQEYAPFAANTMYWHHEEKEDTSDYFPDYEYQEYGLRKINIGPKVEHIPAFMFYGMYAMVYKADYTRYKETNREADFVVEDSIWGVETIDLSGALALRSIGDQAFRSCGAMLEMTIPSHITSLGIALFADCDTLQSVNIQSQIEVLPSYMFMGCEQLHDIVLPNSIKTLSYQSFKGCKALESITLPNALTTVGPSAFQECDHLLNIDLPVTLTAIDGYAFSRCTNLNGVILPASLQTIGNYAFEDCTVLSDITFAGTPKLIGNFVFSGCRNLNTGVVHAPRLMPRIKDKTFYGVANSMTVLVDDDVRATYAADPYWGRFFAPTDLEEVENGNSAAKSFNDGKTLKNGQIFILKNNKTYNIIGQQVK